MDDGAGAFEIPHCAVEPENYCGIWEDDIYKRVILMSEKSPRAIKHLPFLDWPGLRTVDAEFTLFSFTLSLLFFSNDFLLYCKEEKILPHQ